MLVFAGKAYDFLEDAQEFVEEFLLMRLDGNFELQVVLHGRENYVKDIFFHTVDDRLRPKRC